MSTEQVTTNEVIHPGSKFLARPSSRLGWWSAGLAAVCLFVLLLLVSGAVKKGFPRSAFKLFGLVMVSSGLGAGVTSTVAMVRNRERSWLVVVPLAVGLLFFFFVIAEMVFE